MSGVPAKSRKTWHFWIDVGGTFTDCIGRSPDGVLKTCKVLSSGIIKGEAGEGSDSRRIIDPALTGYPEQFFTGYTVSFFNPEGVLSDQIGVKEFARNSGTLLLEKSAAHPVSSGMSYEISSGEKAPVLAIRKMLGLRLDESIKDVNIRLGTTVGTNTLLERSGAPVAYVTTKGFGDLLEIGTQARPELFKLHIVKPAMLYRRVVELDERIDAAGKILKELDEAAVEETLQQVNESGISSIAVCLLNSVWNPAHEQLVEAIARRLGFSRISVSHQITPTIKILDRGDTTVVDAYLSPVIRKYVAGIRKSIPEGSLKLMTSSGGLADAENYRGKDSILSGPAGGVAGFADVSRRAGFSKAIGFDMGGTSTDVSRFDGDYEYQFTTEKAGVRIVAPMYSIETVAAGGGSICRYNEQRLLVGPESAGANPGPACYGRGGPLTVSDVNFFNGKINQRHFPFPLDKTAVIEKLEQTKKAIERAEGRTFSIPEIADGFTKVANLKMAAAIKRISSARGYNPSEYVLVSFGGAGAQHACAIARQLGIGRILLHPLAGILSAYGLGVADIRRFAEKTVLRRLTCDTLDKLDTLFNKMEQRLTKEVRDEGISPNHIKKPVRYFDLHYAGEESTITVRLTEEKDLTSQFEALHRQLYGYAHEGREVEIVAVRSEVAGETGKPVFAVDPPGDEQLRGSFSPEPERKTTAYFDARPHQTAVYRRERLSPGLRITGPAIISEAFSTIVVDPGWAAVMTEQADLLLIDESGGKALVSRSRERDPVRLELFSNHFIHIASQMGITLQKTALSVNVKERLDFSCAILSGDAELVVNAPHIPVHLGAMSEAVKGLLAGVPDIHPGDVYLSNDPDLGGSHLPDLTVMTPVFDSAGKELRFFTASRAHHAEIGGIRPGSAYPFAANLAQEGVVLTNLPIVKNGQFREELLYDALTQGPYPSRQPEENIADIRAAVAANHVGVRELHGMIERHSWETVRAYMKHIRDAAAEKVQAVLAHLGKGEYAFEDALDNGAPLRVRLLAREKKLVVDFTGSAPVNPDSLNANRAVVQSAIMYCLRCLLTEDVPLNSGMIAPVELILPEGMLNPPSHRNPEKRAAVFGGNVEISQRIVDVVFGALGIAAASQGTMNNFIFGNQRLGYYETICGGSGAGGRFDGASAVHTHMTNTRITDVEVLEKRYPVRVRRFAIRGGSGGAGRWRGGEGVIREFEFLAPMEVSLLTQRRTRPPFGLKGGMPGKPGENLLYRKGEKTPEKLDSLAQLRVNAGDVVAICTPGGGGYGKAPGK